jgi:hypothetical protein
VDVEELVEGEAGVAHGPVGVTRPERRGARPVLR